VPAIAAALDARVLSSRKEARVAWSRRLAGPAQSPTEQPRAERIRQTHDALLASKVCAYAQGMELIGAASANYGWNIDRREMARIWKGGCIIRARLLDSIMRAYEKSPGLDNLLLDDALGERVQSSQAAWREQVARAARVGIPLPATAATLAWYDSCRTADLPQNLTQAQRDAFGAHTYQRRDRPHQGPDEGFVHTDWLSEEGK
jgi:6-phosphogluconate dehydrogenase